ncbi:MAG: uncharacterized protein K0R14_301 [Burkholderiales bacterium]|jgi:glutathione S-transferase|nr:uncharacterized protein [Burkholderiales bacterium]
MINIYGFPLSSPTNKVLYVINYLDVPYEYHHINLALGDNHKPEYLKINPYAKIPAINDGDFNLAESNAITRYLASKYNSELYPQDIKKRAIIDQWLDYASQHIMIPFSKIMFNTYFYKLAKLAPDERSLQDGYTFLSKNLPIVEFKLSEYTYIAGNELSLADFAMLASMDTAELSKVDLSVYPCITAWRDKLKGQSFYLKCHNSYTESFHTIMQKIDI